MQYKLNNDTESQNQPSPQKKHALRHFGNSTQIQQNEKGKSQQIAET